MIDRYWEHLPMTTIQGKDGHTIHITPKELHKKADASAWFVSDIKVPANAQKLLVQYVGIPEDQVTKHVTDIVSVRSQSTVYKVFLIVTSVIARSRPGRTPALAKRASWNLSHPSTPTIRYISRNSRLAVLF